MKMELHFGIDELIFLSNVALAIVTIMAIWTTVREDHRHEEVETKQLANIVHEVLAQEAREEVRDDKRDTTA